MLEGAVVTAEAVCDVLVIELELVTVTTIDAVRVLDLLVTTKPEVTVNELVNVSSYVAKLSALNVDIIASVFHTVKVGRRESLVVLSA